jgi:hypothetical protein
MNGLIYLLLLPIVGFALFKWLPVYAAIPLYALFVLLVGFVALLAMLRRNVWQSFRPQWQALSEAEPVDEDLIATLDRHDKPLESLGFRPVASFIGRDTGPGQLTLVKTFVHSSGRKVAVVGVVRAVVPVAGRDTPLVQTASCIDIAARRSDGTDLVVSDTFEGTTGPQPTNQLRAVIEHGDPSALVAAMDVWTRDAGVLQNIEHCATPQHIAKTMIDSEERRLARGWMWMQPDQRCRHTWKGIFLQVVRMFPPGSWFVRHGPRQLGRKLLTQAQHRPIN